MVEVLGFFFYLQKDMSSEGLLDIQPSELKFTFESKKQSSCSLHLANKTGDYVAFKVKTTNPKKYCVRPNTGVVAPRSACDVTVTMQAQSEAPPDMRCKDRFLIQSVVTSQGATSKDINAETFTKGDGKIVEECKMEVVYVPPLQTPSSVPEEGSSPQASYQSDNRNVRSYLYDAVSKAAYEPDTKNSEVLNIISTLNTEKLSAIQLNQKLQQELELLRKEHSGGHHGFSFLFVVLVGILGILVGYLVKT